MPEQDSPAQAFGSWAGGNWFGFDQDQLLIDAAKLVNQMAEMQGEMLKLKLDNAKFKSTTPDTETTRWKIHDSAEVCQCLASGGDAQAQR